MFSPWLFIMEFLLQKKVVNYAFTDKNEKFITYYLVIKDDNKIPKKETEVLYYTM